MTSRPLQDPASCPRCGVVLWAKGTPCRHCAAEQSTLALAARCSSCGRALHDDRDLLELAEATLNSIRSRGLVVPDMVAAFVRIVRSEMACRLGACQGRAG